MSLAIRGIDVQTLHLRIPFHNEHQPHVKVDYVLTNPPFNDNDWRGELLKDYKRWVFGVPPAGNANFAWVRHLIYHLAPTGLVGFVLVNDSMSSNQSGEGMPHGRRHLRPLDCVSLLGLGARGLTGLHRYRYSAGNRGKNTISSYTRVCKGRLEAIKRADGPCKGG